MVPVRSEPTQPELPSVLPIRLWPWDVKVPKASGRIGRCVFPATIVLPMYDVSPETTLSYRPPPRSGGVAADGAVGQRGRAGIWYRPPPTSRGVVADGAVRQRDRAVVIQAAADDSGVAADGAVGQRGRAIAPRGRRRPTAELPLTVQSVSVVVPWPDRIRRRRSWAELSLTVQSVSVIVPPVVVQAAAVVAGGVAADGAVGQRDRAAVVVQPAAIADRRAPGDRQPRDRRRYTRSRPGTPGSSRRR